MNIQIVLDATMQRCNDATMQHCNTATLCNKFPYLVSP